MNFLNMGPGEMIMILVLALLIFGPKRLPELARDLGKTIRSFQEASQQVTGELTREMNEATKALDETKESLTGALTEVVNTTTAELTEAGSAASGELNQAVREVNAELQKAANSVNSASAAATARTEKVPSLMPASAPSEAEALPGEASSELLSADAELTDQPETGQAETAGESPATAPEDAAYMI
jgi:TatA/E family protein of Tat protein translocase